MNWPLKIYKLLNVLSLDVALGAVCSSAWLANYFHVQLRIFAYCALGLTVWIIYTADHLLDAYRIKHEASSFRHQFHQQNFRTLLTIVMLAILADVVLVFFVRSSIFYSGLLLAVLVTFYLVMIMNRWLTYLKEFLVAILYCGGVLLPILSIGGAHLFSQNIIMVTSFFLTALLNIILFSWFDREVDERDNQPSLVLWLGDLATRNFIYALFIVQLLLSVYGILEDSSALSFFAILLLMNSVLLIIFFKWEWFSVNDRYRLAGDAIFLFPIIHLLLQ